jgi:pimeloyl-ACP methyl ester carboxylesterase
MRYAILPLLAGISLAAISCTDQSPVGPSLVPALETARVTTPGTGPWARVVNGETGPGALYALYIPTNWNGDAIYFAHGIRPPLDPITLDANNQDNFLEVRDALGALGYAFAYSSFSENGLAVKDGAQRTHQLSAFLNSELPSKTEHNYLAGYSLGALVALDLAERFPGKYDGVLAMCGMVGGTPRELQYVGDVRALFDYYYPGVLPGNVISVPTPPPTIAEIQGRVIAAITANPLGLYAIASTAQTPLAFAPIGSVGDPTSPAFQSLVGSLITALYYQLLGTPDVLGRTHGHSPYDNRTITYTMGTLVAPAPVPSALIASMIAASNGTPTVPGVTRYDITPDAQNYLDKYYVPTGGLRIPVVSVHNYWDPLVPFFHEQALAATAAAAGSSSMLLQRGVPNYGHCNFSTPLVVGSFQTLANWVRTGVKPAS